MSVGVFVKVLVGVGVRVVVVLGVCGGGGFGGAG